MFHLPTVPNFNQFSRGYVRFQKNMTKPKPPNHHFAREIPGKMTIDLDPPKKMRSLNDPWVVACLSVLVGVACWGGLTQLGGLIDRGIDSQSNVEDSFATVTGWGLDSIYGFEDSVSWSLLKISGTNPLEHTKKNLREKLRKKSASDILQRGLLQSSTSLIRKPVNLLLNLENRLGCICRNLQQTPS